ncbi:MAG TPA: MBL fold metallo-hydrolase [Bdellovibrionales bacterium]|nr:MBL fold metallo-hydrolase [Bdellovibrionales bacterium]
MKVHHLNCGTMCPAGGRLLDGFTPGVGTARLVCHCLLVETAHGLVLIDTGTSLREVRRSDERIAPFFKNICRPLLKPAEAAYNQLKVLGYDPADVRHIVVTHLDFDHAGALEDFPNAMIHIHAAELEFANSASGFINSRRYRPEQWAFKPNWLTYTESGERWFGFERVRQLEGLPPEILMVPLVGHTWGHCGVAVRSDRGWLFLAGDAYFYRREVRPDNPRCTPGLRAYQRMMEVDREKRLWNQRRLRRLVANHRGEIQVFSSHDAIEFEALFALSLQGPMTNAHTRNKTA